MRKPFIAGNWKMNTTVTEATNLVKEMRDRLNIIGGVEIVLCPPFISLNKVAELIQGSSIKLGAQNMHFEAKGAYTGEISPQMLFDLCNFIILGHSERRQFFAETDDVINKKMRAAVDTGLRPILCVGEKLEENKSDKTGEIITTQVRSALAGVNSVMGLVIAYEPIWAIGTGLAATGEQANTTIGLIRHTISELYSYEMAQLVPILYGGSVIGENIAEFVAQSEIDGALVGGASLKPEEFISIVEKAAKIKGSGGG